MALSQRYVAPPLGVLPEMLERFYDERGPKKLLRDHLSEDERESVRLAIFDLHDRMIKVFQVISPALLLIFRWACVRSL